MLATEPRYEWAYWEGERIGISVYVVRSWGLQEQNFLDITSEDQGATYLDIDDEQAEFLIDALNEKLKRQKEVAVASD